MKYLALGDSISIDDYTGVPNGGAVSQLARLAGATEVEDLTRDGATTDYVLSVLEHVTIQPDVITLTAGGNDLLTWAGRGEIGADPEQIVRLATEDILSRIVRIYDRLAAYRCTVIANTIYDPTDGDDSLAATIGISPRLRATLNAVNEGITVEAERRGFLVSDLHALFHGHGFAAAEPWLVSVIEPNYAGATAIARHWMKLLAAQTSR